MERLYEHNGFGGASIFTTATREQGAKAAHTNKLSRDTLAWGYPTTAFTRGRPKPTKSNGLPGS